MLDSKGRDLASYTSGVIMLCSEIKYLTLTVPLSTQECKLVQEKCMKEFVMKYKGGVGGR